MPPLAQQARRACGDGAPMTVARFAGIRVCAVTVARAWYERLLGEPPFFSNATEVVWTLADDRSLYDQIGPGTTETGSGRAGGATLLFVPSNSRRLRAVTVRHRLLEAFRWTADDAADTTGWWRDAALMSDLVDELATLIDGAPTVVAGVASRGFLLGGLVAHRLGVGFVEIRKDLKLDGGHGAGLLRRTTPPDYAGRSMRLTIAKDGLAARDRVLLVDDWIATGAQAEAAAGLVEASGASLHGTAVIVDATTASVRRRLQVRSLVSVRELEAKA